MTTLIIINIAISTVVLAVVVGGLAWSMVSGRARPVGVATASETAPARPAGVASAARAEAEPAAAPLPRELTVA